MSNANTLAFPTPAVPFPDGTHDPSVPGLTKREYAAIQILAGMGDVGGTSDSLAKHAVKRADALLAELTKQ